MRNICRADKTLIALLIRVQGAIDWNPQLPGIAKMLSMHFGSPFSESAECYYVSNETKNRDDATGKINHHKANHVRCRFFFNHSLLDYYVSVHKTSAGTLRSVVQSYRCMS